MPDLQTLLTWNHRHSSFKSRLQDSDFWVRWRTTKRASDQEHVACEKMLRDVGLFSLVKRWSTAVCKRAHGNYEGDRVKLFLVMIYAIHIQGVTATHCGLRGSSATLRKTFSLVGGYSTEACYPEWWWILITGSTALVWCC